MQKVNRPFKLKDKITGLYYCPLRFVKVEGNYIKSNLSKNGKIYFKNPLKHIKWIEDHTQTEKRENTSRPQSKVRTDVENLEIEFVKVSKASSQVE